MYSKKIEVKNLSIVDEFLNTFVGQLAGLYDPHIMKSGVHELLHLVDSILESGPLNSLSCYPFEELNRKLGLMVNGKDLIGDEFIKLWSVSQCLGIFIEDKNEDNKYLSFMKENFALKSSNLKKFLDVFCFKPSKKINLKLNELEKIRVYY
ncbi:unnamed protein product [Brachionus calyciflorus]|uniref:Uncharacterized protein n=1 Tax=Brachionus calyciflorus TaxID=104777 RepID=A0A814KKM9_9BILA|nr:unnamed protein product [Brachionus calyciflorus]